MNFDIVVKIHDNFVGFSFLLNVFYNENLFFSNEISITLYYYTITLEEKIRKSVKIALNGYHGKGSCAQDGGKKESELFYKK